MTTRTNGYEYRVRPESMPGEAGPSAFIFCADCGCVACWRALAPGKDGRRRIAVNLRLAEPEVVGAIVVDHFDGLVSFDDLGRDGRCVSDMWF